MGCNPSKLLGIEEDARVDPNDPPDSMFYRLKLSTDQRCRALACIRSMEQRNIPYLFTRGLLLEFQANATWDVYIHVSDWDADVTSSFLKNVLKHIQYGLDQWLRKLNGFDGFTKQGVKVRLFGIVFQDVVIVDTNDVNTAFDRSSRVYNWAMNDENSPWCVKEVKRDTCGISIATRVTGKPAWVTPAWIRSRQSL